MFFAILLSTSLLISISFQSTYVGVGVTNSNNFNNYAEIIQITLSPNISSVVGTGIEFSYNTQIPCNVDISEDKLYIATSNSLMVLNITNGDVIYNMSYSQPIVVSVFSVVPAEEPLVPAMVGFDGDMMLAAIDYTSGGIKFFTILENNEGYTGEGCTGLWQQNDGYWYLGESSGSPSNTNLLVLGRHGEVVSGFPFGGSSGIVEIFEGPGGVICVLTNNATVYTCLFNVHGNLQCYTFANAEVNYYLADFLTAFFDSEENIIWIGVSLIGDNSVTTFYAYDSDTGKLLYTTAVNEALSQFPVGIFSITSVNF